MPRDGCKECSRRRITCDKGTPDCAKCLKKGISCTGIGRQIKFVDGLISKGKRKGKTPPNVDNLATRLMQHLDDAQVSEPYSREYRQVSDEASMPCTPSFEALEGEAEETALVVHRKQDIHSPPVACTSVELRLDPGADLLMEFMKPGIQMLFNHFSRNIASIMVVFDSGYNGYRNFMLPLAHGDELVQRAVSVVAAFHMSSQQPDLLPLAESGRSAIIQKLRIDAFAGESEKVFNMSTWATIILLLVGETVTGSQDFVHLYPMLTTLLSNSKLLLNESSTERSFLLQQSRMFQLFTPPLLDQYQGCETFQRDLSFYSDFLFSEEHLNDPCVAGNAIIFQGAIEKAKTIYMRQALGSYNSGQLHEDIDQLRLQVLPIKSDSPGMHTLPWVYFIAAASSKDQNHRKFFADRLVQVYEKTRMNNIIVALERLEQIWLLQPNGEWARNPSLVNPVLII